ncbi:MAG: hypothetical protein ABSA75_01655 [Candidatus Bathyarchaeia archaeon]|jgi:hypothetical protein
MKGILGYGEDALTFWAMRKKLALILDTFRDKTDPSNCLVFYRPSFGRRGGEDSTQFGEFDAIIASETNIFLIESKWDNLSEHGKTELKLREEQLLRHKIFAWFLTYWKSKYFGNWELFLEENKLSFPFQDKNLVSQSGTSILETNLEYVLFSLKEKSKVASEKNIKNVLLFFYNKQKTQPPKLMDNDFTLVPIDYSKNTKANFIPLDGGEDGLTYSEAKQVAKSATDVRFNSTVLFFAFIAGLIGLLQFINPINEINSLVNSLYSGILFSVFVFFSAGLSWSFSSICHTTYLIDKMINEYESAEMISFLKMNWKVNYLWFIKKDVEYRKHLVGFLSIFVSAVWVAVLLLKLFT